MAVRPSAKLIQIELAAAQQARRFLSSKGKALATFSSLDLNSEDEAETGTTAGGFGGPLIDMSLFGLTSTAEMLLAEAIRRGEAKFGWVPATRDPSKQQQGTVPGQGPQSHPLLSVSQQWAGIADKLNASPENNAEARDNYNRLANELRPGARPQQTFVNTPTHKPV